jgi:aspartyl-tRNA(Asn)/glutamyl-tRNA(Gln) amidotransferase subunit A
MTDLATLTASEMLDGYADRRLSPVDVVEAVLARIDRLDPQLNSVVHLDANAARKGAHQAERALREGQLTGPLHGVPVGIKDVIDVAGMPTTCHSKILAGNQRDQDAAVVRRLRDAGAIIFCKLSTHEFALGGPSFDLPFPPARNPWNRDHNPGGSSSGSAAAVAAALMPITIGTDTAGSIRHPAGACGILGLKPTYDAVSREGVFPLAFSLDHVGPLARSTADIELTFRVIAERSAVSLADRPPAARPLDGMTIGYVRHFHVDDAAADPEVAAALDRTADQLAEAGARVEDVRLPPLDAFLGVNRVIMFSEGYAVHADWLCRRPEDYGRSGRQRLMAGAFLTAEDYIQAQRYRRQLIQSVEQIFEQVDLLLVANMLDPACRIDDLEALAFTGERQARAPFNVTGHPALSIVTGFSGAGLPLSAQLVGRRNGEGSIFRAGALFDSTCRIVPI